MPYEAASGTVIGQPKWLYPEEEPDESFVECKEALIAMLKVITSRRRPCGWHSKAKRQRPSTSQERATVCAP